MNPKTSLMMALALSMPALLTADKEPDARPQMEVCFVLDTTGSMGGLIQGAKDKIWSIANEMASAKPTPRIKIGLIGYRDRGDAYVTRVFDLSEDLDDIYGKLMNFQAQGGGDTPESVNQALQEAVTRMTWNPSREVLKIVFLVGDAPPHMDYQDDVKYPDVCQEAMKKDLIINTIQCGAMAATTPIWKEIASKSEGEFAAILQDGGTVAVSSPYDEEIARLNRALNETVVGYGDRSVQISVAGKLRLATAAKPESVADRSDFFAKTKASPSAGAKVISGEDDLVALLEEGKADLKDLDAEKLPEELKNLSPEERDKVLQEKWEERKKLNAQMEELVQKRSSFVEQERTRLKKEGKGDGFDDRVKSMLRAQAARKGIEYNEDK